MGCKAQVTCLGWGHSPLCEDGQPPRERSAPVMSSALAWVCVLTTGWAVTGAV